MNNDKGNNNITQGIYNNYNTMPYNLLQLTYINIILSQKKK